MSVEFANISKAAHLKTIFNVPGYKKELLKRLRYEVKLLREELAEIKPIFDKACNLFSQSIHLYCEKNDKKNPFPDLPAPIPKNKKLEDSFKSIFRKIAIETHPDKVRSEDFRDCYEEATLAAKNSDIFELFGIASDLKVEIAELSFDEIDALRLSIKDKRVELSKIYKNIVLRWYYANNNTKDKFVKSFIECNIEGEY